MRPEGGHIILLDLHLVALEVRELKQADLVLHAVLQGGNETWDGREGMPVTVDRNASR